MSIERFFLLLILFVSLDSIAGRPITANNAYWNDSVAILVIKSRLTDISEIPLIEPVEAKWNIWEIKTQIARLILASKIDLVQARSIAEHLLSSKAKTGFGDEVLGHFFSGQIAILSALEGNANPLLNIVKKLRQKPDPSFIWALGVAGNFSYAQGFIDSINADHNYLCVYNSFLNPIFTEMAPVDLRAEALKMLLSVSVNSNIHISNCAVQIVPRIWSRLSPAEKKFLYQETLSERKQSLTLSANFLAALLSLESDSSNRKNEFTLIEQLTKEMLFSRNVHDRKASAWVLRESGSLLLMPEGLDLPLDESELLYAFDDDLKENLEALQVNYRLPVWLASINEQNCEQLRSLSSALEKSSPKDFKLKMESILPLVIQNCSFQESIHLSQFFPALSKFRTIADARAIPTRRSRLLAEFSPQLIKSNISKDNDNESLLVRYLILSNYASVCSSGRGFVSGNIVSKEDDIALYLGKLSEVLENCEFDLISPNL